jgi:hypothetical protein
MMTSNGSPDSASNAGGPRAENRPASKRRRKHRGWRVAGFILLGLVIIGGIARALMPWAIRHYVNKTLDQNQLYEGRIGTVGVHLWRGAYSIQDITLSKRTGTVPVPFFAAQRVEFSIQWDALLHHRMVGQFVLQAPQLNFVAGTNAEDSQAGEGGPWLQTIRDLFPFKINSAVIHNGSIHFRTYQSQQPVDVYLSHVEGTVDNLGNIRDESNPLVTTVNATATAMDQAKLEFKMSLDPFSYRPTFQLALRMLGLDVTKLNELSLTYGKFDFKRGWFDLVVEANSKEGRITGYVKPLFRDLKVFSVTEDMKEGDVLQFFWQALIGAATSAFKNYSRDQFGTLIPFTADASGGTTTDIIATIGNLLRNAFVRAYLPRLEPIESPMENDLQFGAPDFGESLSTTSDERQ